MAILELQEKGEIQILYDKWWKKSTSVCARAGKEKDTKANSLGVVNIGGIFIVLLAGLGLAVLVAIFEFCYYSKYTISSDKVGRSHGFASVVTLPMRFLRIPAREFLVAAIAFPGDGGRVLLRYAVQGLQTATRVQKSMFQVHFRQHLRALEVGAAPIRRREIGRFEG